jgi:hypothetical protein
MVESRVHEAHPFQAVEARRSVDELFFSMQNSLVLYTGQADMKANIVITTSSLVLTVIAALWNEDRARWGLGILAAGTLMALISAITVVIPKFRLPKQGKARIDLEAHENPLFFGHFAAISRERWVEILADIASNDVDMYEAQARDIHDQGVYLIQKKYRHLRFAYIVLAIAFVGGAVAQSIAALV